MRSVLFLILQGLSTIPFAILGCCALPFNQFTRYRVITGWTRFNLWLMPRLLGIRWKVIGRENIPPQASVILSKHQSAWETLALQAIFPPQVYVLKRELLRVPFFGWGLAMLPMIAIDRKAKTNALTQVRKQGEDRIRRGWWVVVFPEGTRVAPGDAKPFKPGGAALAAYAGTMVVPVAHNAGELWPRNAFIKKPGEITVSIGPPIDTRTLSVEAVNRCAQEWVEAEMRRISPEHYGNAQAQAQ